MQSWSSFNIQQIQTYTDFIKKKNQYSNFGKLNSPSCISLRNSKDDYSWYLLDVSFSFQGVCSIVAAVEDMRIKTLGASFYFKKRLLKNDNLCNDIPVNSLLFQSNTFRLGKNCCILRRSGVRSRQFGMLNDNRYYICIFFIVINSFPW